MALPPVDPTAPPTFITAYERFRPAMRAVLTEFAQSSRAGNAIQEATLDELGDAIGDIASAAFYDEGGQRHPGAPPPGPDNAVEQLGRIVPSEVRTIAEHLVVSREAVEGPPPPGSEAHDLGRARWMLLQDGYPATRPVHENVEEILARLRLVGEQLATAQRTLAEPSAAADALDGIAEVLTRYGFPSITGLKGVVERLCVEHRHYREAHSHAQQLRDHYTAALAAFVLDAREAATSGAPLSMSRALRAAEAALANPPEWDRRLRA